MTNGYKRGGVEQKVYNSSAKPSEAGYSSTLDLAKFTLMFINNGEYLDKQIISESVINESYLKQNNDLKYNYGYDYGLCWKIGYHFDQKHIAKWGEHAGGMSAVIRTKYTKEKINLIDRNYSPFTTIGNPFILNVNQQNNSYSRWNRSIR